MKEYREELADKYPECRVFIEYCDAHNKQFIAWVKKKLEKYV